MDQFSWYDTIIGSDGNVLLVAGKGNNSLSGWHGNDTLMPGEGNNTVFGGDGLDTMTFGDVTTGVFVTHRSIRVGATLFESVEFLTATEANDTVRAGDKGMHIDGKGGNDLLVGGAGTDTLLGGSGNDTIEVTSGQDSLLGEDGNDQFLANESSAAVIYGGDGYDHVSFSRASQGVSRALAASDPVAAGSQNNRYYSIEPLSGSTFDDYLGGDAFGNILSGEAGDDTLFGASGNDILRGGAGNDEFRGGVGYDEVELPDTSLREISVDRTDAGFWLSHGRERDFVHSDVELIVLSGVGFEYQTLRQWSGVQLETAVVGSETGETLEGTTTAEFLAARGGWDWINPGGGPDTIDGGEGRDMVSFVNLPDTPGRTFQDYRLDIDLGAGTAVNHTGSEQIQLINVERITGTIHADRIRGSDGDDQLRGSGDYDWFIATQGADTLDGGNGKDMVSYLEWLNTDANQDYDFFNDSGVPPMSGDVTGVVVDLNDTGNNTHLAAGHTYVSIERITGSGRQDVFYGDGESNDFRGLGDYDWFVGSADGRERYFGGDGVDTVTYFRSTSGVTANLRNGATVNGQETGYGTQGDAARDLYFEIENLIGTNFDDSLTGNGGRNQLSGLDGDDMLFGYGGIDQLKGGAGNDTLNGGGSSDYAIFSGDRAEYTITKTGARSATVSSAAEGTDTLLEMEYLRFADGDVAIWDLF